MNTSPGLKSPFFKITSMLRMLPGEEKSTHQPLCARAWMCLRQCSTCVEQMGEKKGIRTREEESSDRKSASACVCVGLGVVGLGGLREAEVRGEGELCG